MQTAASVSAYDDRARVAEYDARMDVMHPNRIHMATIVADALSTQANPPRVILDLGTGTGFLAAALLDRFPAVRVVAVDAADAMLNQAKARLGDRWSRVDFITSPFQKIDARSLPQLDAVVSSFALHHLSADEKLALYRALRSRLNPGAMLLNADIAIAASPEVERRRQTLRVRGIVDRFAQRGVTRTPESIADELAELERRDGDQPLTLTRDLGLLCDAGFTGVDCWWQEHREAVWGGFA